VEAGSFNSHVYYPLQDEILNDFKMNYNAYGYSVF
jgi:hypothetical protein